MLLKLRSCPNLPLTGLDILAFVVITVEEIMLLLAINYAAVALILKWYFNHTSCVVISELALRLHVLFMQCDILKVLCDV